MDYTISKMASNADEEVETMSDVELSSDEECEEDDEVSLIVLKRPPAVVRTVQDVEVRNIIAFSDLNWND